MEKFDFIWWNRAWNFYLWRCFHCLGDCRISSPTFYSTENTFATHYHELNEMSVNFERIKNFPRDIQRTRQYYFPQKTGFGGSEHSFGIHVAKLAGMPSKVVNRASEILKTLKILVPTVVQPKNKRVNRRKFNFFFPTRWSCFGKHKKELTKIDINTLKIEKKLNA